LHQLADHLRIMAFYSDLTELRREGKLSQDRVQAAKTACRGGYPIRNLSHLATYLCDRFPVEMPYFDSSMSEGDFPRSLAAFKVSVYGSWSKIEQHGIYVVFGNHLCKCVNQAKGSFTDNGKFRDQLAGAKQHYANGLMHCVKEAKDQGLQELRLPCQDFEDPVPLLKAAQLAVQAQRVAASLRAEKYASPGGSDSFVFAYKSALENLAIASRILGSVDEGNAEKNSKIADSLENRANSLSLASDKDLLEACSKGEAIAAEADATIKREKRAAAATARLVPAPAVSPAPDTCLKCASASPTHWGYTCRCRVLCEGCVEVGDDALMECPRCGDYTEFVPAEVPATRPPRSP